MHPLHPGCPPRPPRPTAPLASAAASFVPPASCQAGVRALNAGKGPADGYHRWSVEIGRIGLSHRPFLRTQQKPPNKSTKIPKITKRKCHLSFTVGLCGGSGPAALLACTRVNTREVTRISLGVKGCRGSDSRTRCLPVPNARVSPKAGDAAALGHRDGARGGEPVKLILHK